MCVPQTLCDFPDAPGSRDGMIRTVPVTSSDMVAKLVLTYMDGLPLGTTRTVELFDRCPQGFSANFGPIQFVKTGFIEDIGLETSFYAYRSDLQSRPTASLPSSGYMRKEHAGGWIMGVPLDGATEGYSGLQGTYSGFFEFGTTRRRFLSCKFLYSQGASSRLLVGNPSRQICEATTSTIGCLSLLSVDTSFKRRHSIM